MYVLIIFARNSLIIKTHFFPPLGMVLGPTAHMSSNYLFIIAHREMFCKEQYFSRSLFIDFCNFSWIIKEFVSRNVVQSVFNLN